MVIVFKFLVHLHTFLSPNNQFIICKRIMPRTMISYTKQILVSVSFDPKLFCKEVEKAVKTLLPYEIEQLIDWLQTFTTEKPELRACLAYVEQ